MQLGHAARSLGAHRAHHLMGVGGALQGAAGAGRGAAASVVCYRRTAGSPPPWRSLSCVHAAGQARPSRCAAHAPHRPPLRPCCRLHSTAAAPSSPPLAPSPLSPSLLRPALHRPAAAAPFRATALSQPASASAVTYLSQALPAAKPAGSALGTSLASVSASARGPAAAGAAAAAAAGAETETAGVPVGSSLVITRPDDWHLHLRDGEAMACVLPFSAQVFRRAIIMPNLRPPVTTVEAALAYRGRILGALPQALEGLFEPLMTLYLTDATTPEDVRRAKDSKVVHALKLYPAGATTNSDQGVTDLLGRCLPTLECMADIGMPLLVHGEVVDPSVDFFDREAVFIERVLGPLLERVKGLRVVMEHITTADAAQFVLSFPEDRIAATVTPQHMLWNRNSLFLPGGIRPHNFCLPILKREMHREAVTKAATSGSPRFFLGTDSAPHERRTKEAPCGCAGIFSAHAALPLYAAIFERAGALANLEAFASFNGPEFYRLPRNTGTVALTKEAWGVPEAYPFGGGEGDKVVPMMAGEQMEWAVSVE